MPAVFLPKHMWYVICAVIWWYNKQQATSTLLWLRKLIISLRRWRSDAARREDYTTLKNLSLGKVILSLKWDKHTVKINWRRFKKVICFWGVSMLLLSSCMPSEPTTKIVHKVWHDFACYIRDRVDFINRYCFAYSHIHMGLDRLKHVKLSRGIFKLNKFGKATPSTSIHCGIKIWPTITFWNNGSKHEPD